MIQVKANETCIRPANVTRTARGSAPEVHSWQQGCPRGIPRNAGQAAPSAVEPQSLSRPCPYEALVRLSSEARRQLMAEADREQLPLGQVVRRRFFGLA
jgi:hypothetical protein